jgi:hypothetical protein
MCILIIFLKFSLRRAKEGFGWTNMMRILFCLCENQNELNEVQTQGTNLKKKSKRKINLDGEIKN